MGATTRSSRSTRRPVPARARRAGLRGDRLRARRDRLARAAPATPTASTSASRPAAARTRSRSRTRSRALDGVGLQDAVGLTPFPILGSMPRLEDSAKTPFKPDDACETQEPPNLAGRRSAPGPRAGTLPPPPRCPTAGGGMLAELAAQADREGRAATSACRPRPRRALAEAREAGLMATAIRKHLRDFIAVAGADRGRRSRSPSTSSRSSGCGSRCSRRSRSSSRPSSRPRRRSSPARARRSASPACGSATSPTSTSRTASASSPSRSTASSCRSTRTRRS